MVPDAAQICVRDHLLALGKMCILAKKKKTCQLPYLNHTWFPRRCWIRIVPQRLESSHCCHSNNPLHKFAFWKCCCRFHSVMYWHIRNCSPGMAPNKILFFLHFCKKIIDFAWRANQRPLIREDIVLFHPLQQLNLFQTIRGLFEPTWRPPTIHSALLPQLHSRIRITSV